MYRLGKRRYHLTHARHSSSIYVRKAGGEEEFLSRAPMTDSSLMTH